MIVSRKDTYDGYWYNLGGSYLRLSGPSIGGCYFVDGLDHSLYHILGSNIFGINNRWLAEFKGTYHKEI